MMFKQGYMVMIGRAYIFRYTNESTIQKVNCLMSQSKTNCLMSQRKVNCLMSQQKTNCLMSKNFFKFFAKVLGVLVR